jgi:ubiquinone biosynthesis protein
VTPTTAVVPVVAESVFQGLGRDLWLVVPAFFFALLAGALIGRVLGIHRSFSTSSLTGVIGWVAGTLISLWVAAKTDPPTEEWPRNLFLFTLLGTMAAAVWIEFVSRPGIVARAQTGLASVPHPIRSVRRRGRRVRRYAEISRIAVRNGLGPTLGLGRKDEGDAPGGRPPARRLRMALDECGGMFVKLGQVLSTRTDLVSADAARELSLLQDHVRPAQAASVIALVEDELDQPLEQIFSSFDWDPVAAASLGQVYRATLPDGARVVVKVQRPGIDEAVGVDLSVLHELARVIESRTSWGREYHVKDVVAEFSARLREELDYRIEARNARLVAINLAAEGSRIRVPQVYEDLGTAKVLVMEWLDGVSVKDVDWSAAPDGERVKLADTLLESFFQQTLQDGVYHADPHPGNVMLLADGRIGLIDFGATGRLDAFQQTALRDMMAGISRRDADAVTQAVLEVATLRRGVDIGDFERALARFMGQFLAPGTQPDAAMFNAMMRLMFDFGISLPAEWTTFFRALMVLEGTLTTIAPGYSVIDAAEGIASKWVKAMVNPGSVQQAVRDEIMRTVPILRRLPRHVDRAFAMLERDGIRVRVTHFADDHDEAVVSKLVNRLVLAFLAGTIGVFSVALIAIEGGPEFIGDTSLLRVFGYFGLFCATVLAMRVIVAVLRDGLN